MTIAATMAAGGSLALVLLLISSCSMAAGDPIFCNSINRQSIWGSLAPKPFKFVTNANEYEYLKSSAPQGSANWCISVVFFGTSSSSGLPDPSTTFLALLGAPYDGFGPGNDNVTFDLPNTVNSAAACVSTLTPSLNTYAAQFKTLYPDQWGASASVAYTVQCCQNPYGHGFFNDPCNWLIPPLTGASASTMLHTPLLLALLSMLLSCIHRSLC